MVIFIQRTRTLDVSSNRCLELVLQSVLKNKRQRPVLAHQKKSDSGRDVEKLDDMCGYAIAIRL
jgi:hypothetical protein